MPHSLDLFVFVDALGWRIAEREGFLADLLPHRSPCETVFGYSSTCDPTILTGCSPAEHGHFSFFVKAEDQQPFKGLRPLSVLPHSIVGHHRVRHHVSKLLAKKNGYTGYFMLYSVPFSKLPFLDYTEKHDIYEQGGIINGQPTIFEHWKNSGRPWLRSDWRNGDEANLEEAKSAVAEGKTELMYLFTSRLDAIMHAHGTQSSELKAGLAKLEDDLRKIHATASENYDEVRLYLFSDHGMADTITASDMMIRFESLNLKFGTDYTAVWDSTMVRFWFENDNARTTITRWLGEQKDGSVVPPKQLTEWGCGFEDERYGELFYLLPAGTIFAPSFMNQNFVTGMHGYDPAHPDSTAAWLSNVPNTGVRELGDIYGVMRDACDGNLNNPLPEVEAMAAC